MLKLCIHENPAEVEIMKRKEKHSCQPNPPCRQTLDFRSELFLSGNRARAYSLNKLVKLEGALVELLSEVDTRVVDKFAQ